MPRPSKYQLLADFLAGQQDAVLRLTFRQIEAILGVALPDSVYAPHHFWRRPPARIVRTLATVGWQARLDPHEQAAVFTRVVE